jgi:hypothetical protein
MSKKVAELIGLVKELFLFSQNIGWNTRSRKFYKLSKALFREAKTEEDRDGISDLDGWLRARRNFVESKHLAEVRDTLED